MRALAHHRWQWLRRVFTGLGPVATPSALDGDAAGWRIEPESAPPEWQTCLGPVVHELRVPLSALSGEVELALFRERSPAAYREALTRIGARVTDLIEVTDDLACLGQSADGDVLRAQTAHLADALAWLSRRLSHVSSTSLRIDTDAADVTVRGDERLLARALTRLVEHALRHRPKDGIVCLRVRRSDGGASIDLILEAPPRGFARETWRSLEAHAGDNPGRSSPRPFGLLTAWHVVRQCGGSLSVAGADDSASVRIRLRCAHDGDQ